MRVSDLYGTLKGEICIVGSGPSLSVFPKDYFRGRYCMLLNDVQKHLPGVGPFAFANNKCFLEGCDLPIQIVKARLKFDASPEKDDNHEPWNSERYYCFSYRDTKFGDETSHFDKSALWREPDHYWNTPGGTVAIFAVQFAILAGYTSIQLIGCDCCEMDGKKYVAGKEPGGYRHKYNKYASGMMRMIQEGRKRGVSIVQVNPFPGIGREEEQYREMGAWTDQ